MQWYQITFTFIGGSNRRSLTNLLLTQYIQNILSESSSLSNPFITNVFALNQRNNSFDTSLPPFLFIECVKADDKTLVNILQKSGVQYISCSRVTEERVNQYRLIHDQAPKVVWSGIYIIPPKISKVAEKIREIPDKIHAYATEHNIEINEVICPQMSVIEHETNNPIVIYISHSLSENEKVKRMLSYSRNITDLRMVNRQYYYYVIGKITDKEIDKARNYDISKYAVKKFQPGNKVIIIEGDMQGLKGTVMHQENDIVTLNINIFDTAVSAPFSVNEIELIA